MTGQRGSSAVAKVKKIGLYSASTLISAISGVVVIPVLVGSFDAATWGSYAYGQALGGILGIFGALGWAVSGPAVAAGKTAEGRLQYFVESLHVRVALLPITLGLAVLLSALLPTGDFLLSAMSAAAAVLTALSASWWFVGVGRPGALVAYDTVPRVVATLGGCALAAGFGQSLWLPGLQVLAAIGCAVVSLPVALSIYPGVKTSAPSLRDYPGILKAQVAGVLTNLTAATYTALPVLIVGLFASGSLPVYALVDRLVRYGGTALTPAVQFLQSWVPSGPQDGLARRVVIGVRCSLYGGVICGLGFGVLAPFLADLLSHGQIEVPLGFVVIAAVTFAAITASRGIGLACLVALGKSRLLASSTAVGAAVGLVLLSASVSALGAVGTLLAVAVSEVLVLAVQVVGVHRWRNGESRAVLVTSTETAHVSRKVDVSG